MRRSRGKHLGLAAAWLVLEFAGASAAPAPEAAGGSESVAGAMCRIIDSAAARNDLPTPFLAKLIWRESRFKADAQSPVGAQGIAQFMPGTAAERGLANPFDPEQAIPQAARLLADLRDRFGNLGLAAAAYNGGPGRVSNWLAGAGSLPQETIDYVAAITGESVDQWAAEAKKPEAQEKQPSDRHTPCIQVLARLQRAHPGTAVAAALAPWGVQLSGSFSKAQALAIYERSRSRYASVIGGERPMVIGTRVRSRGTRPFYRVRVPSPSRSAATSLCDRIQRLGGACVVLRT